MSKYLDERNCSKIIDGHAWTELDHELFSDMRPDEQERIRVWIRQNIVPRKNACHGHTSYGIKHLLERDTGIYMTNNQFKDAMLVAGYEPVNPRELNWEYRISRKSPCFKLAIW